MRRFALSLVLLLAALSPAGPALAAQEVTDFTLDNGMEVVVIEDHRAPVAVHMVWYRAGAADEPPGQSGIAHFLEHLMFKGTETLDSGEFSDIVSANGGSDNAFTSYDYTGYFQRVAADRLDLMMRMEADRMVNLRLTERDIVTERDVILEERNQRVENDPGSLFREQRNAALYLNHPYRIPIIGWRHEMQQLDMEAAKEFYRTHYAPNNAILIVAGDVTPDEVRDLAEKHYGPIPASDAIEPRERPAEPPHRAPRRLVFEDSRVSQPYLARDYLAPERDSGAQEEAAALVLLAQVLGGGQTSVLKRKLQFEQQVAVYSGAFHDATSLDTSSFGLIVVPDEGVSLSEAEAALDKALEEFMEEGVDQEQLDRIKLQLRASRIYESDDVEQVANRYGRALTQGLTVADVQAWPEVLQAVTAEDIMAAAERLFDPNRSVTGWLTADAPQPATDNAPAAAQTGDMTQ